MDYNYKTYSYDVLGNENSKEKKKAKVFKFI